jgi:hypothetical protein
LISRNRPAITSVALGKSYTINGSQIGIDASGPLRISGKDVDIN